MALREILSNQAASAAVVAPTMDFHATNPIVIDSHANNSIAVDSHATNSIAVDSHATNSNAIDSHATNSIAIDSHATNSIAVAHKDETSLPEAQKERIIDLNLDCQLEEENGDSKKGKTDHDSHKWTGLPEISNAKLGWMKSDLPLVKTELSLGSVGAEVKFGMVKPELEAGNVKPDLELGLLKPSWEFGLVKPDWDLGPVKPELELDLNMSVKEEVVLGKERKLGYDGNELLLHQEQDTSKQSDELKVVVTAKKAWTANLEFLQDCIIRLLCVFALDR